MNRRPAQIASVATIAVSAVFLLTNVHGGHRHYVTPPPHPALLTSEDALPNARVPDTAPALSQPLPSPAWTVAFEKSDYKKGTHAIWVVHPGGEKASSLLENASEPCWSTDHRQIAFAREGNVWVAQADGSAQRQLTFWQENQKDANHWSIGIDGISWHRQGQFLSFGRSEKSTLTLPDGKQKSLYGTTLYHVSLSDTGDRLSARFPFHQPKGLTASDVRDTVSYSNEFYPPTFDVTEDRTPFQFSDTGNPAWDGSGRKMAFVRNGDIWIADAGAKEEPGEHSMWDVKRIAACAEYDGTTGCGDHWTVAGTGISWAPDNSFLVYSACRITGSGQEDMHLLTLREKESGDDDGHRPKYIDTSLPVYGRDPSVSTNGKWIVYSGSPIASMNTDPFDAKTGLWAVTIDGKQCVPIFHGYGGHPVW